MFKNKFLSIFSSTIVFSTLSNFCCDARDYIICIRNQQIECTDCHQVIPNLPKYSGVGNMVMVCHPSDNSQRSLCLRCKENDLNSFVKARVRERIPTFDADAVRNLIDDTVFCNIFPKAIFRGKENADLKCAICLEDVDVSITHASCHNGHLYHRNCVGSLARYDIGRADCPQCGPSTYLTNCDPNSQAIADSYKQSMRRVLNNIVNVGHY